jgi:hypothetical protein
VQEVLVDRGQLVGEDRVQQLDDVAIALHGCALLLGGVAQSLIGSLNHTPQVTNAFGALGRGLAMAENVDRPLRAGLDGGVDVSLANAVAVADVHGAVFPAAPDDPRLRTILM